MAATSKEPAAPAAGGALPRIVFVLGKGGVGRSTVATALALARAARGERVLVVQWAVADAIGPWFGRDRAGAAPVEVWPGVATTNFSLDEALRAYFVDHLHLRFVYRRVIHARQVRRLIEVAPGIAEMFFLGQLWWLTTLAEREAHLAFDRIVVDAPATGHATSLLDVPATLASMGAAGMLALELGRVVEMLADPARTGAIVVTLPEPLVVEETRELIPRVSARLGRPPLALAINRSAAAIVGDEARPAWLAALGARMSAPARAAIEQLHGELRERVAIERVLVDAATLPVRSLPELPGRSPADVARALAPLLDGGA